MKEKYKKLFLTVLFVTLGYLTITQVIPYSADTYVSPVRKKEITEKNLRQNDLKSVMDKMRQQSGVRDIDIGQTNDDVNIAIIAGAAINMQYAKQLCAESIKLTDDISYDNYNFLCGVVRQHEIGKKDRFGQQRYFVMGAQAVNAKWITWSD